jgi:Icc-related predicted phosphoesterase
VLRREPTALLCGHIHERRGAMQLGRTLVVNCSVGCGSDGVLVTIEAGAPPRAELL